MGDVLTLGGIAFDDAAALLRSYGLALQRVADGDPIPGSYWGDSEAGIIGSWCGRKFRPEQVMARPGWESVPAVVNAQVFEIKSSEILQPGPAALTDGVRQIQRRLQDWARLHA